MSKQLGTSKQSHKDSHRCVCGKMRFRDKTEAVDALHRIQNKAERAVIEYGTTHRQEVRSYLCGLCNGFHLTSAPLGPTTGDWKLAA